MPKLFTLASSLVVLGTVVGCTGETPPPRTTTAIAPPASTVAPISTGGAAIASKPPPPSTCIQPSFVGGPLTGFEQKSGKLFLCLAVTEEPGWVSCLSFDPKSGTYGAAEGFVPTPPSEEDWPYGLATDGALAKVCLSNAPTQCRTVKPGFRPKTVSFEGAVSADGKSLFLYRYMPPAAKAAVIAQHKLFGEVFDVSTGKKTASFPLPVGTTGKPQMFGDQTDDWTARWYGPHLLLSAYRCCGPAGMQAFVEPKTGKLHGIGDPTLLLPLGDDTFLIGNEERAYDAAGKNKGKATIAVFDAKTFNVKTLSLPNAPREEPETFVLGSVRLDDGTIALAYANPPGIVVFDPKTKTLGAPKPAPICSAATGPSTSGAPLVTTLEGHVGEKVHVDVTKAKTISQHMTSMMPGKNAAYFVPLGSEVDFVGYIAAPLVCSGTMRLTGKVIEVSGPGKGPSSEKYAERQLDVETVECR